MLQESFLDTIGATIGDKISIPINLTPVLGDNSVKNLLSLMLVDSEGGYINYDTNELIFQDRVISLHELGVDEDEDEISKILHFEYTIADTYQAPNGKFSLFFSNAAMVECSYVFSDLVSALIYNAQPLKESDEERYDEIVGLLEEIASHLKALGVTFCNFAFDIESVLKDQQYYYLDSYKQIK